MEYQLDYPIAAAAPAEARVAFIRRTYAHLFGAILAFVGIEAVIFNIPGIEQILMNLLVALPMAPVVLMLGFIGVSYLANYWANSGASPAMQYAGLGLYVVAQAIIFVPLLFMAMLKVGDASLIFTAGVVTLLIFAGLTAGVFLTGKDFSYLGPVLGVCSMAAFGFIILALFLPGMMGMGTIFAYAMVALASGYIIYDTSNVIHQYRTDQHVAASLALFASVALLFWYVLRILMARRD